MDFINKTAGIRLDLVVSREFSEVSRKEARLLANSGLILVNGKYEKAGFILKGEEKIELLETPKRVSLIPGEVLAAGGAEQFIEVLYEDKDLLAVSKPREMHSIRLNADDPITLADCLAAYFPDCAAASSDPREAGLVQRLDFYTSGVVLAAKNSKAHNLLREAFSRKEFKKTYLALIEGLPEKNEFEIKSQLKSLGKKMFVCREEDEGAQSANTLVGFLKKVNSNKSLLRLTSNTGRRHQIRVHLASLGHPLVGDELYGAKSKLVGEEGFFLHAESLEGKHPVSNAKLSLACKPSEDFLARNRI